MNKAQFEIYKQTWVSRAPGCDRASRYTWIKQMEIVFAVNPDFVY